MLERRKKKRKKEKKKRRSEMIGDWREGKGKREKLNTMFGWGENREDKKQREENRVENSVFDYLAKEGKLGGRKTWEKVFSPKPTIFIVSNWEEKA